MVEGSKACSKRNKTRARRRARMEIRRGLEGALEKNSKGGRIGNALPQVVEGSKARSKRTQKEVG